MRILVEYGREARLQQTFRWLEKIVFQGVDGAPSQTEDEELDPDIPTTMDPRDLEDLEGDLTVELEALPDLFDDMPDQQSSASNNRAPLLAIPAASASQAHTHQAVHPAPVAAAVDARATSSQVSYVSAVPLRATSSGSRVRPVSAAAMSSGGLAPPRPAMPAPAAQRLIEEGDYLDGDSPGVSQHHAIHSEPQREGISVASRLSMPPANQQLSQPVPSLHPPIPSQRPPQPHAPIQRPPPASQGQFHANAPDALAAALADVDLAGQEHLIVGGRRLVATTLPTPVDAGPVEDAPRTVAARKGTGAKRGGRGGKVAPKDGQQGAPKDGQQGAPPGPSAAAGTTTARATRSRSRAQ